jgi:hypothetical protein
MEPYPLVSALSCVPRYYFHLFNDVTALDEEGADLPNEAAALRQAEADARHMAASSVEEGHLILDHRIEVANEHGHTIGTVRFGDVVVVKTSAASG